MSEAATDRFEHRHLGPRPADRDRMLEVVGAPSLGTLIDQAVPAGIRLPAPLDLPAAESEARYLDRVREIGAQNERWRSFIGQGYYGCVTPSVILRNVLENPGWYTPYTPYQAEAAQGRLEALLNFQTLVEDLTAMDVANASLLDEATAAAEAMTLAHRIRARRPGTANRFVVAANCFPQTIAVVGGRAEPLGIEVVVAEPDRLRAAIDAASGATFGVLLQSPDAFGTVRDVGGIAARAHEAGALVVVASDLLALTLVRPPGEQGADVVVGSAQRFGVPMGYGGPHAAFFATRSAHVRQMPGRLIGVSVDAQGRPAYRMALQTREQHIRRERATSNICTAQALLANVAAFYAVYHGPDGLTRIAGASTASPVTSRGAWTRWASPGAATPSSTRSACGPRATPVSRGCGGSPSAPASTSATTPMATSGSLSTRHRATMTSRRSPPCSRKRRTAPGAPPPADGRRPAGLPAALRRTTPFLTHPVFNRHHSELQMMRYVRRLERKDIGLDRSMIPLGSCTMKLNAATELRPVTWPEFGGLHPFVPVDQAAGYRQVMDELARALCTITGFAAVSLQPNSGAQGELAGLLVIRAYHRDRGEAARDVVLIPASAHGTNPASAVMAGMRVVVVACAGNGDVDVADLRAKALEHRDRLSALIVTYPSTHGVFEDAITEICAVVHEHGGQVYMDGANMNAQVGLTSPARIGADVCHLNLHKTFAIPHGGGGPGMGPIAVAAHLAPYLPGHPLVPPADARAIPPVAAAPWGSASILLIAHAYVHLLGGRGMRAATEIAILSANYVKARLEGRYDVLYTRANGRVAHELIFDLRPLRAATGITEEDVAKRLMDYGFHAPTVSFPVPGTLMVEPTESEPLDELDRFCDAMLRIRDEIEAVADGRADARDNVLKGAPHTAREVTGDEWRHAYSRRAAAYPLPFVGEDKFWPPVGRIDNAHGDRNLVCACPPVAAYAED